MDLHPAVDRLFRSYIGYAELLSLVSGDEIGRASCRERVLRLV